MHPLPDMEAAREQQQLYQRFLNAKHRSEMFGLVKSLTEREYQVLVRAVQEALLTANRMDALGIRQRIEELEFYWRNLRGRPTV